MKSRMWVLASLIALCITARASCAGAASLTAAEAEAVLNRDWLFQAMGEPLPQRSAKEIAWARQIAQRLARATIAGFPGGPQRTG